MAVANFFPNSKAASVIETVDYAMKGVNLIQPLVTRNSQQTPPEQINHVSSVTAVAQAVARIIDLVQAAVAAREKDQDIATGVLQEQAREAQQKDKDEAIAKVVDAQPTLADRHAILDGLRSPEQSPPG